LGVPVRVIFRLKILVVLFLGLGMALASGAKPGGKNDLFAGILAPFTKVFAKKSSLTDRTLQLELRLESMTGLPAELAGSRASVKLAAPDKVLLSGPVMGQEVTICRDGQEFWVSPGSKLDAVLASAEAAGRLGKVDPNARVKAMELPLSELQLVFLPALFQVQELDSETLDGAACRVIDVEMMPELVKILKGSGWKARVWAGEDAVPMRIRVRQPDWEVVVRIDSVRYFAPLGAETWKPSEEQSKDLRRLSAGQFRQLLNLVTGGREEKTPDSK